MLALATVLEKVVTVLFFRNLCYIIVGIIKIDLSARAKTVFFEFIRENE